MWKWLKRLMILAILLAIAAVVYGFFMPARIGPVAVHSVSGTGLGYNVRFQNHGDDKVVDIRFTVIGYDKNGKTTFNTDCYFDGYLHAKSVTDTNRSWCAFEYSSKTKSVRVVFRSYTYIDSVTQKKITVNVDKNDLNYLLNWKKYPVD